MQFQFPPGFLQSLQQITGFNAPAFIDAHEDPAAIVSVRFNPGKTVDFNPVITPLLKEKVPWSQTGYYLGSRPSFTVDPLFHAGSYYVQEPSSMFLEYAIRKTVDLGNDLKVLDCCAAPGGKSTLVQSILSAGSVLISNEVIRGRANILAENVAKWAAANVIVTNNETGSFQRTPGFFDLVVADAPCSGSGLFRKDPAAMLEWSMENVELCSIRQKKILSDVLPALKPGGILIYSTCSFDERENEAVCDWLIEDQHLTSVALSPPNEWGIVETLARRSKVPGYRFFPDKLKGEGFFLAVFQKNVGPVPGQAKSKLKLPLARPDEQAIASAYLNHPDQFQILKLNDQLLAMPHTLMDDFAVVQPLFYLKQAGISLGSIAGKELIPAHQWALSTIRSGKLPLIELELEDALQFLRRQEFHLSVPEKGWALVAYRGVAMGLVKLLPNRLNNYYPREWRIVNK